MRFVSVMAAVVALASSASAQPAGPQPLRGVVSKMDAGHIVLRPKSGKPVAIELTPDWAVQLTKPIGVAEIKEGSFIGTTEIPQADGTGRSLEVHVFPPGVKMGEGHYAWNLRKGSMMTNGTVGKVTVGAKGRELQVSYPTGVRKIVVPSKTPIVQITPGTRSMVKVGTPVFVMAVPKPGGGDGLMAGFVAVGEGGAAPPM